MPAGDPKIDILTDGRPEAIQEGERCDGRKTPTSGRDMPEDRVERRSYLRVAVDLEDFRVRVEVQGAEPTTGVVLDVGRGGMRVALGAGISEESMGGDCLVRFIDAGDRVSPTLRVGTLKRIDDGGGYAIEFKTPLDDLKATASEQGDESE